MAPVANNPRQGSRLAVTIMYGDRPAAQTLPFVIPSNTGVWLRGKGEQTDMWEVAALYVDHILHLGSGPDNQQG